MAQNLYATKVFSRHPSAVWALDEDLTDPENIAKITSTPASIPLTSTYSLETKSYGDSQFSAYYIGETSNTLSATNYGVPLVYGAESITSINPVTGDKPSLIVPGFGLFNQDGKAKSITLEAWVRIEARSVRIPKKIIGPISSADGLYVNGPFLTLKVEDYVASHFVGEWGRPMLIHIGISNNTAFVMINGEQVITILLDTMSINFPTKYNATSQDQDWIGFYAYADVSPINVDCVSIFPYRVDVGEAKIRFISGQSVDSLEVAGTGESTLPVVMDYSFSKYANNYSYPDKYDWQNGILDNVSSINSALSVPNYALPTLIFEETRDIMDWYDAQEENNTETIAADLASGELIDNSIFFEMNPTNWGIKSYILFPKFNLIDDTVDAVYAALKYTTRPAVAQTIFKIYNYKKEYFRCYYSPTGTTVKYEFVSNGTIVATFDGQDVLDNTMFGVGINIPDLLNNASATNQMRSFFANKSSLEIYFCGESGFVNGYSGKVYKIGFSNAKNYDLIKTSFTSGLVSSQLLLLDNYANYTLFGVYNLGSFALDIATYSYWEDYIPLTLLAKNSNIANINYSLDFIQFNVDYPASESIASSNVSTVNEMVKTYVYFSELTKPLLTTSDLSSRTLFNLPSTKIVSPDGSWATKIYEVVDGSIIYIPSVTDFTELGLNIRFEMKVPGIFRNPVKIKNMQLSSQSLNNDSKTLIGSKLGRDLYPYTKPLTTFVYNDSVNPFVTYKGKTPYLYLNKTSGIQLLGSPVDGSRGIEIPFNESEKRFFLLDILQFGFYYDKTFSSGPQEILRIGNKTTDIFAVMVDGIGDNTKAILYVKDLNTGNAFLDVDLYINGLEDSTASGVVTTDGNVFYRNWNFVSIKFDPPLSYEKTAGAIRITGPFLVNNISHYQVSEEEYANKVTSTNWGTVLDRDPIVAGTNTWTQTVSTTYEPVDATWFDVYADSVAGGLGKNPSNVYGSYFGASAKSSIQTNIPLDLSKYSYTAYLNVNGATTTGDTINQSVRFPSITIPFVGQTVK
jgi:hypothetical protein